MFPFPYLLAVNILVELTTIWMILQGRRRPYQILRIKQRDAFLIVGLHVLLQVKEDVIRECHNIFDYLCERYMS